MNIRPLVAGDLPAVASLHRAAFPTAAISRLGDAVAQRFYASLLNGPHNAVGIGAFKPHLVGYCFAGMWRNAEIYFLRSNAIFLGCALARHPTVLWDPRFRNRFKLALTIVMPGWKPRSHGPEIDDYLNNSFGIQSIAVDPKHQGSAAATALFRYIERIAREKGFQKLSLSVHLENARAIRFYEKMGWKKFAVADKWSGLMYRDIV